MRVHTVTNTDRAHTHTRTYTHTFKRSRAHMHAHAHHFLRIRTCTRMHACAEELRWGHTHIPTQTYMRAHVCISTGSLLFAHDF